MPTLDWIGKQAVRNHHREVPYRLLKCDKALSVGDPGSGNLVVQGDNLVALKALLPYYAGQVKCIYIDPPYNTGNEGWVYNDATNSPEIRQWLGRVVGAEAEDLSRHDKWLCMMYPRLQLLKQFLREDGLMFVSIDNNEQAYLALMMEEIFGAPNHVETLVWKKSYGGGSKSKHIVNQHEYILCYARRLELVPKLDLPPDENSLRYYKFRDGQFEQRGPYRLQPLATNSMDARPNLRYAIPFEGEDIWPEKQWQWAKERAYTALENDELVIAKNRGKWTVSYKQYLRDTDGEERRRKAYSVIDGIYTQQGTNEIKAMFGDGKTFSFPKPSLLIRTLLELATDPDSLILDSFAGSGTTGQAVLDLNRQDGGSRRFILIEMEEAVCRDVTTQRLTRVLQDDTARQPGGGGQDTSSPFPASPSERGFRFCTLGEPLFDETGNIRSHVTFSDLAAHVFFTETGEPIPQRATGKTPLIGICQGIAYYLLFNGVLGDRRPDGGNVLTSAVLDSLPPHAGPRIVYGEGCRLGSPRLQRAGIVFKQVPYEIKVS